MIRFPPSLHVRSFLDLLEFVAAARPPLYPYISPYLSLELPSFATTDADCRACIERVLRLVELDAPPPATHEWLELFNAPA